MDRAEVVELAMDAARQRGHDVGQYDLQVVEKPGQWEVHFRRKGAAKPSPGDFFLIRIDDRSRSVTRYVPGK